jgi:hypothetical protein
MKSKAFERCSLTHVDCNAACGFSRHGLRERYIGG